MTMQDTAQSNANADQKTLVVVAYVLMILGVINGFTALIAVVIAHVKRSGAAGTIWQGHYDNIILAFWVGLVVFIVGWILMWVLVGFIVLGVLAIWYLYRAIRGLILASEARPYA
jgi:uncharacterized membrane protein